MAFVYRFLDKVEVLKLDIPGLPGDSTIDEEFKKAKRLYPSIHSCDGFFIVKMVKK